MKVINLYDIISTNITYEYLFEIGSYANELYNLQVYHIDEKLLNLTRFTYLYIDFKTFIPTISNNEQKHLKLNTFTDEYIYTNYEFCVIPLFLLFNANKQILFISTVLKNFLIWASPCIMKYSIIHYQKLLNNLSPDDGISIDLSDTIKKELFLNISNTTNHKKYNELGVGCNAMYEHGIKLNKLLHTHILKTLKTNKYKINFYIPFNLVFIFGLDSIQILENFKFYFNYNFYYIENETFKIMKDAATILE